MAILGLEIPTGRACPGHAAPFEAFANAFFARDVLAIWKASRGFGGKSVILSALGVVESITLGAAITLLGGSGEQSKRVHAYMEGSHPNFPDSFWGAPLLMEFADDIKKKKSTTTYTRLVNGGEVDALTASQKSVRGPHPQRLRGDEIDEMDQAIWDAAKGQPITSRGILEQTVGSSTHQNVDGVMTSELKEAHERGYGVYEWCYRESHISQPGGWLTDDMVRKKKSVLPALMWKVEVELQEPAAEGRAIHTDHLERMFNPEAHDPNALVYVGVNREVPGGLGAKLIFEEPYAKKDRNGNVFKYGEYGVGADWGKRRDKSIFWVWRMDVQPHRCVAFYHLARQPWPIMIAAYEELAMKYGGGVDMEYAAAAHDATGVGDVIDDYLEVSAEGVAMRGKTRSDLFNEYILAIEADEFVAPRIKYAFNEHKFLTTDDLMGHGHPADTFVAAAMAYKAGLYGFMPIII